MPWTNVISDLNSEEIVKIFYKKELQKLNQKVIRRKVIKTKDDKKAMLNGKATIILLTVGLMKKTYCK